MTKVLMAYVPEWKSMKPEQIPGDKLTHLLYAFSLVNEQGECTVFETSEAAVRNLEMIKEVKARYPHLNVFISVGGWTGSANFSANILTADARQRLIKSCIDMWIKGGAGVPGVIDSIDIDWEYPGAAGGTDNFRPEDKQNFVALMTEFRQALDALGDGKRHLLSAAFGVTPAIVEAGLDLPALAKVMDYFNLMIYDLHGAGEPTGP